MPERPSASLPDLRAFLRAHLLESVLPFWERHALDPAGGLNTCIRDDGTLLGTGKWLWSQWRAVWVFASLYRMVEPRPHWLRIAREIADFAARHGWDAEVGGWVLLLSADGAVLRGCDSIYVDGFAIYGLTALAAATGEQRYADLARRTADHVLRRLAAPHDAIPHFPYPVPKGARVHGLPMIFSLVLWELGRLLDEARYRQAALALSDEVFDRFYRPDRDLVLERIGADGAEYPGPLGTAVVPGHVLEDMWFQIHIARDRADRRRIEQAMAIIRRHLELGWDAQFGGLLHAVDADGRAEVGWPFADAKLWWPHTESMYALLLAHEQCGAAWCLPWYDRVHRYAFAHYPVAGHGEWTQKLSRDGSPLPDTVALPVKDPFHLPRALLYCIEVLGRLVA